MLVKLSLWKVQLWMLLCSILVQFTVACFLVLSRSLKECANFYESSGHIPIFFFLAFRSSMDGDSDNYCRGDAKSWDGGSCYLCSEVWLASNLVKNNLVLPPG